ncbi:GAF domain-containing protein, partial [Pseudomonas marginalis]
MMHGERPEVEDINSEERSALAEVEGTAMILCLVTRITGMRFAAISKFAEGNLVVYSVHDPQHLGIITAGQSYELEEMICSELRHHPMPLFIPKVSADKRSASRAVVKKYEIESYIGVPIFLPDGRLYGTLCVLDS